MSHPDPHVRPHVVFALPDGTETEVHPGQLIGRARTAALRIPDPRISEAQAMVSLRGRSLHLLALRGMLRTRGGPVQELVLRDRQRIELAPGLRLEVRRVVLPTHVLALRGPWPVPQELVASVHHIAAAPRLELRDGFDALSPVVLWSDVDGWQLQQQGQEPVEIHVGQRVTVEGQTIEVMAIPLRAVAVEPTQQDPSSLPPIRLVLRQETVHVQIGASPVAALSGLSARILSEVAHFEAPTPWDWVAREVFGRELDRHTLRQRWDRNLRTARAGLVRVGLPRDLLRMDGHGNVELVLRDQDAVVDET